MKPERSFIAERALAQHCPELLRSAAPPADLLPALEAASEVLARGLAQALAPLMGGDAPAVTPARPLACGWGELAGTFAPLAANSLLACGPDDAPLLLSLDAAPVLGLIDRAFGGRGDAPAQLPDVFPLSAELMIARLEGLFIGAMAEAFALESAPAVRPLRRDGSIDRLLPFAHDVRVISLSLVIDETSGANWSAVLVLPMATLALLAGPASQRSPAPLAQPQQIDPAAEPFGAMPLSLSAVLIDMALPVSLISALQPGQVLPVSVARSIPLKAGGRTIAHGAIGALDDRVAVQIVQAF